MKRIILLMFLFHVCLMIFGNNIMAGNDQAKENANLKLTVIFDNNPFTEGLQTDWGFSCLVEFGNTKLLFDTGDKGEILMNNMEKLGIDPKSIDVVFLSHYHHDHTGGLNDFLKQNSNVKVYFPQSFPKEITDEIRRSGAEAVAVSSFEELVPGIFTLGEFDGNIPEQALAVRSEKGIIVITGCAHPGIVRMLEKEKELFPDEPAHLVIGGFHLSSADENNVSQIADSFLKMGIQNAGPTHCTGENALKIFKQKYGDDFVTVGVGKVISIM